MIFLPFRHLKNCRKLNFEKTPTNKKLLLMAEKTGRIFHDLFLTHFGSIPIRYPLNF